MTTATLTKTKWNLDKSHSKIEFSAKHLMITTLSGEFKEYDATIETDGDDFATAKIIFTADINSVTTGSEQRDGHLKGNDFFNAEQFPKMTFASTNVEKTDDQNFILKGDLTIRDVTKSISLKVEYEGTVVDPWGNIKSGYTVSGKINRKDFGLNWNVVTEAGGILVSEEVKINCSIQLQKA